MRGPMRTTCAETVSSAATTQTMRRSWSVATASSGTRTPRNGAVAGIRIVPNRPGVRKRSGFGTTARPRIVPVAWSMRLSTKSRRPLRVGSFSSVTPTRTS